MVNHSSMRFKKSFYLHFHLFIHLDERRPNAFETFAGEFLRRVNLHDAWILTFSSDESSFALAVGVASTAGLTLHSVSFPARGLRVWPGPNSQRRFSRKAVQVCNDEHLPGRFPECPCPSDIPEGRASI